MLAHLYKERSWYAFILPPSTVEEVVDTLELMVPRMAMG